MKILFSCDRDDVCMFSFKSSALLCVCVYELKQLVKRKVAEVEV